MTEWHVLVDAAAARLVEEAYWAHEWRSTGDPALLAEDPEPPMEPFHAWIEWRERMAARRRESFCVYLASEAMIGAGRGALVRALDDANDAGTLPTFPKGVRS